MNATQINNDLFRVETTTTTQSTEIYSTICKVMQEIGPVAKGQRNEQQKYDYRGIDDIYNALQPIMAKHNLFCVPTVLSDHKETQTSKTGSLVTHVSLKIEYRFFAKDGSSIIATVIGEAMDYGDKATNKAMTAAQKYAFLQIFSIPTETLKDSEKENYELTPKNPADSAWKKPAPSKYAPAQNKAPYQRGQS